MFYEGKQIGPYTLIRKLGRGGFGEVWLAERRAKFVTTKVAVKLPLDEQIDHETIKQEATLWEQASGHPNILPIIDADEYDGQIVIVSEYAPDGSLDEWLKMRGTIPIEKAVEIATQILDGLEFLHSRNIIHRDLKPANILLQGKTPRLADFGISRALRTTASSQSSNVSGTFAYMPPEGFDGKRSVQTDIWSVGVNLYQFLTGNLPFPQKEPSALIAAIMMRDFEPLPDSIPQDLKNVIARALAKQPENRYATADEMREDLRRFLRGEAVSKIVQMDLQKTQASFPISTIPPTQKIFPVSASNLQDETATIVRPVSTFDENKKRKNLNGWMYATIALFLVSLLGFGVYFLANQSKQSNLGKNQVIQTRETQVANKPTNFEDINNSNKLEPTSTPLDSYSIALESQISCKESPDPIKAIRSLQKAGLIERNSYQLVDSISYFKVKKTLTVFGLNVVSVFGFDDYPQVFKRGPGTSPGVHLGIVVPYPNAYVKSKLANLGIKNDEVEPAEIIEFNKPSRQSTNLTEISCSKYKFFN